jgi:dTDP-4-dehydrorhamnose reductase
MLGSDVVSVLKQSECSFVAVGRDECDITDREQCLEVLRKSGAAIVINCAAFTRVDDAETSEAAAMRVNADGAGNLAWACSLQQARLVHVSTDYVFDGTKPGSYLESDVTGPLNAYGRSKLAGEKAITAEAEDFIIVRSSWLYGKAGNNFVKTMLKAAGSGKALKVVADQVGAPTYTRDLAGALVQVAFSGERGIFHVTNSGACSWYEFAVKIFELSGVRPVDLKPVSTSEYPAAALRPHNSCLSNSRWTGCGFAALPHWSNALERYLAEEGKLR